MLKKLLRDHLPLVAAGLSMLGDMVKGFVIEDKKKFTQSRKPKPKPGTPAARKAKRVEAARKRRLDSRNR